jgi:hypothetical protein
LPTEDRNVDVGGVDIDGQAEAAGHLSRNERRTRAIERLVDGLAGEELFSIGRRMHSTGF